MIKASGQVFVLETDYTSYAFHVLPTGQLEHLYYGRRITLAEPLDDTTIPLAEKHAFQPGNACVYDREHENYSLEDMCLELSSHGKGDVREPFVEIVYADGSRSSDFVYDGFTVNDGEWLRESMLPHAYDEKGEAEYLTIRLADRNSDIKLELYYGVYEDCDVITRGARLFNEGKETVQLLRLMSAQIDFPEAGYRFTTFHGAWAREMQRYDVTAEAGRFVNASSTGTSSSRANPFVMLSAPETTEDFGDCLGCNLIYSGNHYEAVEVNAYGKTRFITGINPQGFCFQVAAGDSFEAPEAVFSYSHDGYGGMSRNMHRFVREHIVRGAWKRKERPVLLNSWEACYFDINEKKLLRLAKAAHDVGIELFVMDDGWFGKRNDDTSSLGDWKENPEKLPNGIAGICRKINALGMSFGIWVEPEMVSADSDLYRAHPDWAMDIPGKAHAEGRHQRLLDVTRTDVQDFIIESMSRVFSSAPIAYVKWDMNRIMTDVYSKALPSERQGEVAHRYVLGLYRCMDALTKRFPKILFEGCAAGGNRFDLGILCYFPQIWASDDTDALCRAEMQTGYSYGYPLSTISAHVSSCPNHQTLRTTPLETRFQVAAFGVCGYECNLCDAGKEEIAAIQAQIALYKEWRNVLQFGTFYRGRNFTDRNPSSGSALFASAGNIQEWTCVSKDRKCAVGFLMQKLASPNAPYDCYRAKGLKPDAVYYFYNRKLSYNVKEFGDLINTAAPVHIKQGSLAHDVVAKFVKMEGETEEVTAYGDTLMYHGVKLKQAFGATGYSADVRHFPDFASRIYLMRAFA